MKLTEDEQRRLDYLCFKQQERTTPLFQHEFKELQTLLKKEVLHCCPNIKCTGYQGTEKDIKCPKCGILLIK